VTDFQRARQPEQKTLRREALIAAATALFDEEGPTGTGLNAIAARAGFTKSNIYRYFESREEVLLSLLLAELGAFVPAFEARVAACENGDLDALAAAGADEFIARPRLGLLLSIVTGVLEQNVSETAIITLKRSISALNLRVASAIQSRLLGSNLEDCVWVGTAIATFVAGMWPNVHVSPTAARVLAMPEFQHLKPVPERDLKRAMRALLASLISPGG
jgi:TetR/AcrR family transcriptional regulator